MTYTLSTVLVVEGDTIKKSIIFTNKGTCHHQFFSFLVVLQHVDIHAHIPQCIIEELFSTGVTLSISSN